uniref:Uncharacterized protein n=1 Tax=Arundo donax TaxID=35708 RepID=A0A0A8ZA25_ARUDO
MFRNSMSDPIRSLLDIVHNKLPSPRKNITASHVDLLLTSLIQTRQKISEKLKKQKKQT